MPSVMTAFRDLDRLREIAMVLARHGFGEVLQRIGLDNLVVGSREGSGEAPEARTHSLAQRLRFVLQDLGPSFVKLGQIASTRADILPADVIAELRFLQDDVKPVPWEDIRREIEADLGREITEAYAGVDERPLASASIAQVHRGRLRTPDGEVDVAIKVQRPNVRDTITRDVDLLFWIARALDRGLPESRRYSPVEMVSEFDRSIHAELDFLQEAESTERFAANFKDFQRIRFPRIYREASGKRVLTMEFFDGRKLNDALAQGIDGRELARSAVDIVIKMIFEDGFFHADPHPGNLMVLGTDAAPVLGLLDFGLVGHLSAVMQDRALDLMVAAAREDFDAVADALHAIGRPTRKVDMTVFRADVAALGRKYVGRQLQDIEFSSLVRDLIWGAVKHGIDMPADFMLVGRALMTMEGTARQIYPDLDVLTVARPHFIRLVARRYAPDRLTGDFLRGMFRVSGVAGQMPEQVAEILEDLRKGHLMLKSSDPTLPPALDRLGRRAFAGMVVAAFILAAGLSLAGGKKWAGIALLAAAGMISAAHALSDWWRALGLRR